MKQRAHGFTIVELLIVIVVIGILAAISIVAYTGISDKANDSVVRDAAAKLEKALKLWAVETGQKRPLGNSGSTVGVLGGNCPDGSGDGFVGAGLYSCSTEDILRVTGYLPADFTKNLPGNIYMSPAVGSRSIMLYNCGTIGSGKLLLLWTLRSPSADDLANRDSVMTSCGQPPSGNIVTQWGMRAAKVIQL